MSEKKPIKIGKQSDSEVVTHEQTMNMMHANFAKNKKEQKERIKNAPVNIDTNEDKLKELFLNLLAQFCCYSDKTLI